MHSGLGRLRPGAERAPRQALASRRLTAGPQIQARARPQQSGWLRGRRDAGRAFPRTTTLRCTARPGTSSQGPEPQALTECAVPAARPYSHRPGVTSPWTRPSGPAASPHSGSPLRYRVAAGSCGRYRRQCPGRPATAANGSGASRTPEAGREGGWAQWRRKPERQRAGRGRARMQTEALWTNGSAELQLTKKLLGQWKPGAGTKGSRA